MKLIDKINKFIGIKNKGKVLIKADENPLVIKTKLGLPSMKICGALSPGMTDIAGIDGTLDFVPGTAFRESRKIDKATLEKNRLSSKFNEIEEIYFKSNEDSKELIASINGVVTIDFGVVNKQYEAFRVVYDVLVLDLNVLFKIYSFTSGEKAVFVKDDNQKNKISEVLNFLNVSSIEIFDFVDFE